MSTTHTPRLSIIIVTYNSRGDIDACLGSLAANPPAILHEIVVVDSASTDGTAAHVAAQWPAARVIARSANDGFAAANNTGIRASLGSLLLLLNPDTVAPAGAIDRMVALVDARPEVAIVGPRLVDGEGRAELSFGRMISPLAELRQKCLVTGHTRGVPGIAGLVERATRHSHAVDWVSGACLLVRRHEAEAAGLLDERYFMYTEDVDFCAAVRASGGLVWFCAEAEIVHRRGASRRSAASATQRAYRRSHLAFYAKHHPAWLPVLRCYLRLRGQV